MGKHKEGIGLGKTLWLFVFGMAVLTVTLFLLLQGTDVRVFNPKGLIASEQLNLMIFSSAVMLVIAIPTMALLYFFAWKYRETHSTASYSAESLYGKRFSLAIWVLPTVFVLILASVMVPATHRLEPKKTIASDVPPVRVQVIAMRWKWLFVYPEYNIATVNFVQVPVDTPVRFELTADEAPMNSFWIPHLSGQLYAMTGHTNPLNVIAHETGDFPGSAAEINGRGFSGMKFTTRITSNKDFEEWVERVQQTGKTLDATHYAELVKPSENSPVVYYQSPDTDLYDRILTKYGSGHGSGHGSGSHGEAGQH